jgi:molecular chaperone GrpE
MDQFRRLAADFDNYKKRNERERAETTARAQADVVRRLLEVVDDLERVAAFAEDTPAPLLEGVQLVERKLLQILSSLGLERIEAEGATFNPATMEGLATVPAETPEEDDVVADVFQQGYLFKGQVLRPARVRVKQHEA